MQKGLSSVLGLFLGLVALVPSSFGLDLIQPGEQTIAGVLVRDLDGKLLLLEHAGTPRERSFIVKAADDDAGIQATLSGIAVDREPVRLAPAVEMRDNGNGLIVPVPVDKPVYPKECYREFLGDITLEAEFHIKQIVRNRDEAQIEKVMPMARTVAKKKLLESGNPQLEMAVTVLERMGLIDEMLEAVAPVFRDAK